MSFSARLPVRTLTVIQEQGPNDVRCFVRCPMQGRSVDATGCTTCTRMQAVEWTQAHGGAVTCRLDAPSAVRNEARRMDFAEAAVRKSLHEVTPMATLCVRTTTSANKTKAVLLAYDLDSIPVVDDNLRAVGVVTRSDIENPERLDGLSENAPVAHAIALMAYERVNHVAIVNEDGELVGMWDSTSALRWTAERMGYVAQ
jgi:CBS domain-containing protein